MPDRPLNLLAVADIMLSRAHPADAFEHCQDLIRNADIAFFNCETPYADAGAPGLAPHGATPHDPRNLPAIGAAGFHAATLANNHALDWGVDALLECQERLEDMGIAVCGSGSTLADARAAAIVERDGVRVAFLGYCCVGPNASIAEDNKPGIAMVRARTIYEPVDFQPGTPGARVLSYPYEDDLAAMAEDVRRAREHADVVVVNFHWGIHNQPATIPQYEWAVGHAAVDAGADLVLGHHPHILKGVEVYRGAVIFHSMGHFMLDVAPRPDEVDAADPRLLVRSYSDEIKRIYPWHHPDQRKSMIVNCEIEEGKIAKVSYRPVLLDEYWSSPEPLHRADPRAQEVVDYVAKVTAEVGLDTQFVWDGDDVVIDVEASGGLTRLPEAQILTAQ